MTNSTSRASVDPLDERPGTSPSRATTEEASEASTQRGLRVLQIGKGWLPEQGGNGLDRVYHSLVQTLPSEGTDVMGLVAGSEEIASTTEGTVQAFAPESGPLLRRLQGVRRATKDALSRGVDVVASHFALYTLPILDLLRETPLVVHFHGPWAQESRAEGESTIVTWAKHALETLVYRQASRCIVLSSAFQEVLHKEYGVPLNRIRIVPGGADVDRFAVNVTQDEARDRLGWPQDRPIVGSVRRLAKRMGLENLIDAVARIRSDVPEILLHIAGTGPLRDELQSLITARNLGSHVRLLGFVPEEDLPLVYRAVDVSVVPTVELEGFGLITIESLAAGTPVLVTPIGGLPETVGDLSERLVLPDASTDALAHGLRQALTDPSFLPSSNACRTYARDNFSWAAIAAQTQSVYREVD